jgi:hypothetical protein
VSTAITPRRGEAAAPRAVALSDRLIAAVPLASLYIWLCGIYVVEAWKRVTPWLFTDELELTQLSRSIASTGHAARRGEPHSFRSLYTIMTAPIWWIQDVATAYSGIKYLDVFVMTSVAFPTYFLARLVVGKRWALFAAAGAATIPSLAYSSWIVEETLAYPYGALCFFLIAKALVEKRRGWVAAAVVASALAPAVRGEFVVIPIAFVLAGLFFLWTSDAARGRRATWTIGDWVGTVVLVAGVWIVIGGFLSWHYDEWLKVTAYNWTKHRAFVYGGWAAGALAVGLGVVPVVAGLASAFPARGESRSRELRAFRAVLVAGLFVFALYTGIKAGYLSQFFATRVEERNLIYVSPLLFVGTALVLERRRVNLFALAAAAAYGLYLVVGTPLQMGVQLYSDALGFAILQQANRYYEWTPDTAQWLLIGILVAGSALVLLSSRLGSRTVGAAVGVLLAVGILAWNVTGEISAAAGNVSVSRELEKTFRHPFSWVDDVAHGKPTLYLGQGISADQNPQWELEFWNRSIVSMSSLDATMGGPGPSGGPNVTAAGRLYWTSDPSAPGRLYDYAVEDWPCVDFAGTHVATHGYRGGAEQLKVWRLIQLTKPNRLRAECSGIYPDGWSGAKDTSYFRFGGRPGWLRIALSRQNWPATPVHIETGSIGVFQRTPAIADPTAQPPFTLRSNERKIVWLRVPKGGFGVQVVVEKKFVPHEIDPRIGDPRTLGAQVDYRFFAKRPR